MPSQNVVFAKVPGSIWEIPVTDAGLNAALNLMATDLHY